MNETIKLYSKNEVVTEVGSSILLHSSTSCKGPEMLAQILSEKPLCEVNGS